MRSLWMFIPAALLSATSAALAEDAGMPRGEGPAASRPLNAVQADLTAERLRAHYAQIAAFTASVEQEKTARFLARPLKSEVELSMKDGRIDWKTTRPVASAIAIDANGIHMESAAAPGAGAAMARVSRDPRALAFIGFLRALFALDFAAIEKDFALTFEGRAMRARPREGSGLGAMIQGIDIAFAQDLAIEQVVVETPDEKTTLRFKTFVPEHR